MSQTYGQSPDGALTPTLIGFNTGGHLMDFAVTRTQTLGVPKLVLGTVEPVTGGLAYTDRGRAYARINARPVMGQAILRDGDVLSYRTGPEDDAPMILKLALTMRDEKKLTWSKLPLGASLPFISINETLRDLRISNFKETYSQYYFRRTEDGYSFKSNDNTLLTAIDGVFLPGEVALPPSSLVRAGEIWYYYTGRLLWVGSALPIRLRSGKSPEANSQPVAPSPVVTDIPDLGVRSMPVMPDFTKVSAQGPERVVQARSSWTTPVNPPAHEVPVMQAVPKEPVIQAVPEGPAPQTAPKEPAPQTAPKEPAAQAAPKGPAPQTAPKEPAPQTAPKEPAPQAAPKEPAPQAAPKEPAPQAAPKEPAPQTAPKEPAAQAAPIESVMQAAPAGPTVQPAAGPSTTWTPENTAKVSVAEKSSMEPAASKAQVTAEAAEPPAVSGPKKIPAVTIAKPAARQDSLVPPKPEINTTDAFRDARLVIDINARRVRKGLRMRTLLEDVRLSVDPGDFVLILGGSGAGKSTFIKSVMGYDRADGRIRYGDLDVYRDYEKVKYEIGYVPQQNLVRMNDTVYHTLMSEARMKMPGDTPPEIYARQCDWAMALLGLEAEKNNMCSSISGGQLKRLSIAIELVGDPGLFFLDEPDSGLDGTMSRKLMENLRTIADLNKIVMVITHGPDRAADLFSKVLVLGKTSDNVGHLLFYGGVAESKAFFGTDSLEHIVRRINSREEGGEGLADHFLAKYRAQQGEAAT